ncbi:FtsX-like permease family protein [Streptomyces sp. CAU 1734]|uniref:FtsX-like permease family protein n=1 Tax=Streptomyces sp. CAU 1734 TaxID=3140360 RepID=UPI0032609FDB
MSIRATVNTPVPAPGSADRPPAPGPVPARSRRRARKPVDAVRLLARRSLRAHRKAWAPVFAAVVLTSALLGATGLTVGSAALGHARVDRYAAADLVVAGDHGTSHTAQEFGGQRTTARAALTERVRLPERTAGLLGAVEGVRAAVPDSSVALTLTGGARKTGVPAEGRPWAAAVLAPHTLRDGRAPRTADEAVVSAGLGPRTGERVTVRAAGGHTRTLRITGTAGGTGTVWLTAAETRRLAGRSGAVDAIGITAEPGVTAAALHTRVRAALERADIRDLAAGQAPRVLTGNGRGLAEHLAAAPARDGLIGMLASVGGTVLIIAVLVLGSLVGQALRQRAGELALLRAVGATPRQIRAAAGREVAAVATVAALAGAALAVPAHLALMAWLRARDVLPGGLELPTPWWLPPGVLVTAALTAGVARLVVPFARAGEKPPAAPGTGRRITGILLLAGGAAASGTAALQSGQTAAAMVGTAAVTMVAGCAVLGPWIARGALRVLNGPLRRLGGPAGRLAAASGAANAARHGAAITPVILMTAFAGVQLSAGATMQRAADQQAAHALRAQFSVTGTEAARLRAVPGVAVATDILRSTVVLTGKEAGAPVARRLQVLGVTPAGLSRTLDPGAVAGEFARLARPGTVSVGEDRAASLELRPGSRVTLRMGDGVERELRVAAVHRNSLALGDFLFSSAELARHMSAPAPARVLVVTAPGADREAVRAAVARIGGARVDTSPEPERLVPEDERAGSAVSVVAVGAIGALTAVTVLTTLALVTAGRRDELALLRRVGAGRNQLRWMLRAETACVVLAGLAVGAAVAAVPLLAFGHTAAHTLPYLDPVHAAVLGAVTAAVAWAGALLPARRGLRRRRV